MGETNIYSIVGRIQVDMERLEAKSRGQGIIQVLRLLLDRAEEVRRSFERRSGVAGKLWEQIQAQLSEGNTSDEPNLTLTVDPHDSGETLRWEAAEERCLRYFISQVCRMLADELECAVAEEQEIDQQSAMVTAVALKKVIYASDGTVESHELGPSKAPD
jgi:hypothetical protein